MGAEDKDKLEGQEGQQDDPKTGEGDGSSGDGGKADDPKASDTEGASGSNGDDVKDKHGQPGINKERHDKEVAELKKEIASLKAEAKEAAENKAKREEYEKKAADLEAKMADSEVNHKLEMAGCKSVKAAKALLEDFDGDVAKLKAEHPFLFEEEKRSGSTGKIPEGAASSTAKTIREALKG